MIALALPVLSTGVEARAPVAGSAAKTDPEALPPGALYRFRNANGSLMISSVLPEQAIYSGYEIIDNRGRVLRVVEPAMPEEERRKMQEEMRLRQQDNQLKRLYPTPEDAERARDRQIASLQLAIDYARGNISQLDGKLAAEVAKAAESERVGQPVPEVIQANIELYTRQIREQEEKIADTERDIDAVTEQFAPIIRRLREIEKQR
ncbi:MAG: hypothetical protein KAG82_11000 [Alcanivoracaceae bacterium]|jgi:hypothetical protein|nr:hypothetical protein [Alcanivoracaceae bacterium]